MEPEPPGRSLSAGGTGAGVRRLGVAWGRSGRRPPGPAIRRPRAAGPALGGVGGGSSSGPAGGPEDGGPGPQAQDSAVQVCTAVASKPTADSERPAAPRPVLSKLQLGFCLVAQSWPDAASDSACESDSESESQAAVPMPRHWPADELESDLRVMD
jgi:hypothetical protein